jgi:hypothetical protein
MKARRNCCKSFKNIQRIILDGYASLHTICGTALPLVFDLQVDVHRTSSFSLPWFLAEDRSNRLDKIHTARTDSEAAAFLLPSVRTAKKYSAAAAN